MNNRCGCELPDYKACPNPYCERDVVMKPTSTSVDALVVFVITTGTILLLAAMVIR